MRKGLSHGYELQLPSQSSYQANRKVSISDFVSKRVNVNSPREIPSLAKDSSVIETDAILHDSENLDVNTELSRKPLSPIKMKKNL